METNNLYGFILEDKIIFSVADKKLLHFGDHESECSFSFKYILLNDNQTRLLLFLLTNRMSPIIDKNEIMKKVWDEWNLSSSNQRLWLAIKVLKRKLSAMGLLDGFITNVHGMGYCVDSEKVKAMFIQ